MADLNVAAADAARNPPVYSDPKFAALLEEAAPIIRRCVPGPCDPAETLAEIIARIEWRNNLAPDDELLLLEAEWLTARTTFRRFEVRFSAAAERVGADAVFSRRPDIAEALAREGWTAKDDRAHDYLSERLGQLEERILALPARTAAAAAVKLRMFARLTVQEPSYEQLAALPFDKLDWETRFAIGALRDLERMTGAAG